MMHLEKLDDSPTFRQQESKLQFPKLEDSPMFRQQIQGLEENAESLRERTSKFCKGCRKYIEGLGEGYDRDIAFASALETFGGYNDPISIASGGPVMAKFSIAVREIGTYKEILRSQIEDLLDDKLFQLVNFDLQDVKEARKRFDKVNCIYDQAREKYLSLRKSTRMDIAAAVEEELHNARSTFEQARFNLVGALAKVEGKKRFEFLEVISGTMDAHLCYFRQGYELMQKLEPYINQVSAYAHKLREGSKYEQAALNERMEEYKRQVDRESKQSLNGSRGSSNGDAIQPFPRSSHREIKAVMQSAAEGKVQTIKQGYLSKRSSNLRGDWKRRFFVLDNRGMLYYYRKQGNRSSGGGGQNNPSEPSPGLLSRWLSSHYHGGVHDEKSVARHTVNLLTSTIKLDADQSDLRFCFRIISPTKNYTLQAESAPEQMDWIEKITGVIASLLSALPERNISASSTASGQHGYSSGGSSIESSSDFDQWASRQKMTDNLPPKNLVRSLALDVKVWEPSIINMFQALGNVFVNSIWEGLLQARRTLQADELPIKLVESDKHKQFFSKPCHDAPISMKEKFIHAKNYFEFEATVDPITGLHVQHPSSMGLYLGWHCLQEYGEKRFLQKVKDNHYLLPVVQHLWQSVSANDKKTVYRLIVAYEADVNSVLRQTASDTALDLPRAMQFQEPAQSPDHFFDCLADSFDCSSSSCSLLGESEDQFIGALGSCSPLHLACQTADIGMVELLLQHGANINASDSRGQTPLHHSIIRGRTTIVKLLLTRGANPEVVDKEGKTPLQLVQETCDDIQVLAILKNPKSSIRHYTT
ncbi:ADP-ribosylation factor GTPase-activating protein AGD3-like isoform X3 [Diospyros lotus]|uniref:ADP-ribosylation factor GTPase-activating protein AGD3-like isoform X3 n=1 Tax=Diospyros lotus TaxID=55363 RepID=UPI00225840C1|nr:ADP-ribosylation factor GTPase-activating protein AGD3-like isoform X3 [Diospyros lotus]